jgi:predicted transcriptional regulator
MRTTIEIKPEHRARLLELAARRGQKGFSQLIEEALDAYLQAEAARDDLRNRAQKLRGSFTSKDAAALREVTRELRSSWR